MSSLIDRYGSDIRSDCRLVCADFSEAMVQQVAKQRDGIAEESPWMRVETIVQNAMDLADVASGSMTHVTAGWVYFMTPDPMKCLTESHRVLTKDGVLALSSWEDSQWTGLMHAVEEVRPDRKLPQIPEPWRIASGVGDEMQKAGFRDVETHRVTVHLGFETHASFVDFMFTRMPHMVAVTKDLSAEEMEKTKALAMQRMKEMVPSEPGQLEGVSIVGVGRK